MKTAKNDETKPEMQGKLYSPQCPLCVSGECRPPTIDDVIDAVAQEASVGTKAGNNLIDEYNKKERYRILIEEYKINHRES